MAAAIVVKTGTTALSYTNSGAASRPNADTDHPHGHSCDLCLEDNTTVDASGYCVTCKKYMCVNCHMSHQKPDATKKHVFVTGVDVLQKKISPRKPQLSFDICERHAFSIAEYYCGRHDDVFCLECKNSRHGQCRKVTPLKEAAMGVKGATEFSKTSLQVRTLIANFENMKQLKELHIDKIRKQMTDCLHSVHEMRKQIDAQLDKQEKTIKYNITTQLEKEIIAIKDRKAECERTISVLENESKTHDETWASEDSRCFVSMIKTKKKLAECDAILANISMDNQDVRYEFTRNSKVTHLLRDMDSLGTLKAVRSSRSRPRSATSTAASDVTGSSRLSAADKTQFRINMVPKMKKEKNLILCGEYDARCPSDQKSGSVITGSSFCPDGKLILCDSTNNSIKVFDHNLKYKTNQELPGQPCDVSAITGRDAVVTLPEKRKIVYISMDQVVKINKTVNTENSCYGIRYHKTGLLVTCYSRGVYGLVQLLAPDGRVLQRIERDCDGNPMFQGPYYLAVNPRGDRLYVADKSSNTVLGLTMSGKVVFRYRSSHLEGVGYMAVDKDDDLYICGRDSQNIHVIRPDGRKIKIFSSEGNTEPASVCYRASDGLFAVSTSASSLIHSYRML